MVSPAPAPDKSVRGNSARLGKFKQIEFAVPRQEPNLVSSLAIRWEIVTSL